MNEATDKVGGELHNLLLGLAETIERSSGKVPFNQELLLALINGLNEKLGILINAQKEGVKTAMDAAEKAVTKAEVASDKRFEGLNELRKMAEDWRSEFARQSTVNLQIQGVNDKIDDLKKADAELSNSLTAITASKTGGKDVWAYIFSGGAILLAFITLVVLITRTH